MAELILYDDFIDFHLIGIDSLFKISSQFIYHLNLSFQTKFERIVDLDIQIDGQLHYFAIYHWYDEANKIDYHLINNLPNATQSSQKEVSLHQLFQDKIILVPNYEDCNFILKISGFENDLHYLKLPFEQNNFIDKIIIHNIDSISTADRLVF